MDVPASGRDHHQRVRQSRTWEDPSAGPANGRRDRNSNERQTLAHDTFFTSSIPTFRPARPSPAAPSESSSRPSRKNLLDGQACQNRFRTGDDELASNTCTRQEICIPGLGMTARWICNAKSRLDGPACSTLSNETEGSNTHTSDRLVHNFARARFDSTNTHVRTIVLRPPRL